MEDIQPFKRHKADIGSDSIAPDDEFDIRSSINCNSNSNSNSNLYCNGNSNCNSNCNSISNSKFICYYY